MNGENFFILGRWRVEVSGPERSCDRYPRKIVWFFFVGCNGQTRVGSAPKSLRALLAVLVVTRINPSGRRAHKWVTSTLKNESRGIREHRAFQFLSGIQFWHEIQSIIKFRLKNFSNQKKIKKHSRASPADHYHWSLVKFESKSKIKTFRARRQIFSNVFDSKIV